MNLGGIIEWAHGVRLGPGTGTDNRVKESYRLDWHRIGAAAVPFCADCGVLLAGKNGIKRHRDLHWQLIDLREDVDYLYEHLGIGDGDGSDGQDSETGTSGGSSEVHEDG